MRPRIQCLAQRSGLSEALDMSVAITTLRVLSRPALPLQSQPPEVVSPLPPPHERMQMEEPRAFSKTLSQEGHSFSWVLEAPEASTPCPWVDKEHLAPSRERFPTWVGIESWEQAVLGSTSCTSRKHPFLLSLSLERMECSLEGARDLRLLEWTCKGA